MKPLGTLTYHTGACQAVAFAHEAQSLESDDDEDMTRDEKVARSRWIAAGGIDHRLSIWELMSFEKTGAQSKHSVV